MRDMVLPTPPVPGVERMSTGLLEAYRYNVSILTVKLGPMSLVGCRYKGEHPLSQAVTSNELKTFHSEVTSWSRVLPDSIRVEIRDVEFTAAFHYRVQELGAFLGDGPVFMRAKGTIWMDDISIKVSVMVPSTGIAPKFPPTFLCTRISFLSLALEWWMSEAGTVPTRRRMPLPHLC
jgi:hypothetical protein